MWVALALFVLLGSAAAQTPIPAKPLGYVSDFANVLTPSAREQLTAICTEVDQRAQAQIAVVTVATLDGRPIEDYTIDLATKWGIGPKQSNRGVLILLAVNDRKYWTQVGYGLEGILPDGKVGGFGREAVPFLRTADYNAALLLITRRVADVIAQDKGISLSGQPPPPPAVVRERPGRGGLSTYFWIGLVIFFLFSLMRRGGGSGRGGRGGWVGPMIAGGMLGGGFGGGGFGGGGGGGGGFGGFGGGSFGGGGAGGSW